MMMFGIDEEVAKLFVKDTARFPKDTDVTRASGIDTLLPGSQIQEFCFDPCGYSMNGLLYDSYWTIHITPESHCSYASFETNIRMKNYQPLVKAARTVATALLGFRSLCSMAWDMSRTKKTWRSMPRWTLVRASVSAPLLKVGGAGGRRGGGECIKRGQVEKEGEKQRSARGLAALCTH